MLYLYFVAHHSYCCIIIIPDHFTFIMTSLSILCTVFVFTVLACSNAEAGNHGMLEGLYKGTLKLNVELKLCSYFFSFFSKINLLIFRRDIY